MRIIQPKAHLFVTRACCVGAVFVLSIFHAAGEVYRVDQNAPGPGNDGLSWPTAFTDLQTALSAAVFGDQIWLKSDTYKPAGPGGSRSASFVVKDGVQVYGGFDGTEDFIYERDWNPATNGTILSGDLNGDGNSPPNHSDNSYHVVSIDQGAVSYSTVLTGVTIRDGYADGAGIDNNGAGLLILEANAFIFNIIVRDNRAAGFGAGGGIYSLNGAPSFDSCEIFFNNAYWGGGMYANNHQTSGGTQLFNMEFQSNGASWVGGGLVLDGSDADIQQSSFSIHFASSGSGVYASMSSSSFKDVTFENNSLSGGDRLGGGIYSIGSVLTMENVTFRDHTTGAAAGGAMYNAPGTTNTLVDVTFQNNDASGSGGAVNNSTNTAFYHRGGAYIDNGSLSMNFGGAIFSQSDDLEVVDVDFSGNIALLWGAGAYLAGDSVIANCSFTGGNASRGVGLYLASADLTVVNSTFTSLRAGAGGGGAMLLTGTTNSFELDNISVGGCSGNAIRMLSGSLDIANSVIWHNTDTNGAIGTAEASLEVAGGTSTIASSLVQGSGGSGGGWAPQLGTDGGGNIDGDPEFMDELNFDAFPGPPWDLRLRVGSPAIDAGLNANLPPDTADVDDDMDRTETLPLDRAGLPRVFGASVDMGAFEGGYTSFALSHPGLDPDLDDNNNGLSNFEDYTFGRDPQSMAGSSGPLEIWLESGKPRLRYTVRGNGTDTSVSLRRSFNLQLWLPVDPSYPQFIGTSWPNGDLTVQQNTYIVPFPQGDTHFWRLLVD